MLFMDDELISIVDCDLRRREPSYDNLKIILRAALLFV